MTKIVSSLAFLMLFCYPQLIAQTLPNSPNNKKDGKNEGLWIIWFDKNMKATVIIDSVVYYRKINYSGGKPNGIVTDYYRSGIQKWSGYLEVDNPEDKIFGEAKWYRDDGSIEIIRVYKDNKIIEEKYFNLDGTLAEKSWDELNTEGNNAYSSGDYKKALEYFQKGLIQAEKQFKKTHSNYSEAVSNIGTGYYSVGDYLKAHQYYTEYLELTANLSGKDNLPYASALFNLTVLDLVIGSYDEAIELCTRALKIREIHLGKNNVEYGRLLTLLGVIKYRREDFSEADSLFREALPIYEKAEGKGSYYYLDNLQFLGLTYWSRGQFEKAEPVFLEVRGGAEKLLGKDHPFYLQASSNMASTYREMGNLRNAEIILSEVLPKIETMQGRKSWDYIATANNLATVYADLGEFDKAEKHYVEVLKATEDKSHQETGYIKSLANLARVYDHVGNFEKAEAMYREALNLTESSIGKNNGLYARNLCYLASSYSSQKKYTSAIPLFEESISIWEQTIGRRNPTYNDIVTEYALALWHLNNSEKVLSLLTGLNETLLDQVSCYFPGMSDREKTIFYQEKIRSHVELFNYFGSQVYINNPEIAGRMFDLQLATKALLLNDNAKWKQRIRTSGDKKLFALYMSWEEKQYAIAKLYMENDTSKLRSLEILINQANALEKELSRRSEHFAQLTDRKRYYWKDVQQKLKPDEAAIEIIRLRKYGVKEITAKNNDDSRKSYNKYGLTDTVFYAALIVTANSRYPSLVLLKNGNELEKSGLRYYRSCIGSNTVDNKSYNLYWDPIFKFVGERIRKIYFSPDGVYNSINLNSLLNTKSKKYIIDETDLQLVTSTKDLFIDQKDESSNRLAILFGYPDYQIDKEKRAEMINKERSDQSVYYSLNIDRGTYLSDLPGTKTEVENIAALLSANSWEPEVFMEGKALEETMKDSFKPRVLHIATHGYFKPDSLVSANKNPLLQSGLMLAGAGCTINGDKDEKTEDGILTAFEAMNLNLDNTDLVVLSACETGLGEVRNGEGVYGLQRAFKVAGARSIIMSLWKVSDDPTQELLTSFYKYWLGGERKGEAFKKAQMEVRSKYPSPFYWGAFVMVGDY